MILKQYTKRFLMSNIWVIFFAFIFTLFASLMQIFPIQYMEKIINGLINKINFKNIIKLIALWYGCRILGFIFNAISGACIAKISSDYSANLRDRFFYKILHSDYINVEETSVSKNIASLIEDVNSLGNLIIIPIKYVSEDLFTFVWASYFLSKINLKLFLFCIPLGLLMLTSGKIISKKTKKLYASKRNQETNITKVMIDLFDGSNEIYIFKIWNIFERKLNEFNTQLKSSQYFTQFLSNLLSSILDLLWPLATVLTLWIGGAQVSHGVITIGGLMSFMWYIQWAINPISQLTKYTNQYQLAVVSFNRVANLFEQFSDENDNIIGYYPISKFEVKNANFRYDTSKKGIYNINLLFEKGKIYSLVGESGSGKSSIIKVISGLYKLNSGNIIIDKNISTYSDLRSNLNIGIATSNPHIFSDTLENNIFLSMKLKNDKNTVLKSANINSDTFVKDLKYCIGNGNGDLSTGQKQRVSLGRLFAANPDFMILDEATSGLDSASENIVFNSLNAIKSGKIILIASHRLSTILKSDYCYIIKNGEVISEGKPYDLIEKNTHFRKLFKSQLEGKRC